jgi:hypothetical protein
VKEMKDVFDAKEIPCRIVCCTEYFPNGRATWHIGMRLIPATILMATERVDDFQLTTALLKFSIGDRATVVPITSIRSGLEGRVVTLCFVIADAGMAYYTDILTEAGKKFDQAFLEEYASGKRQHGD